MNIDRAYQQYCAIIDRAPSEDLPPITRKESCTRLHLIDPILSEVLGWPKEYIHTEQNAGGDRLDYILHDANRACWLVIEAKRVQDDLLSRHGDNTHKLLKHSGTVLRKDAWPIVEKQMPSYLGRFNPNYGVVTNGEQWIAFLHRLRPATVSLDDGQALVFRNFEAVKSSFETFYQAFAFPHLKEQHLYRLLSPERRGYIASTAPRRVVDRIESLSFQGREAFYSDLREAMNLAFKPILDDPEALAACFVESRESRQADSRLERMANKLLVELRSSDEYEEEARSELGRDHIAALDGRGFLARLLGEPSAGKTVFLTRFYNQTLSPLRDDFVLIWIDGQKLAPFTLEKASREANKQLEEALFGEDGPGLNHYRELLKKPWRRRLSLNGLEEGMNDDTEVKQLWRTFVQEQEQQFKRDPDGWLHLLMEFAARNRRRLPIVVLDNVDHPESTDAALRWSVALHRNTYAMITVAMKDTTLWRLHRRSEDLLAGHDPEQFWLHRPKVREVLTSRRDYLRELITADNAKGHSTRTHVGPRMHWTVQPEELVRAINAILLDEEEIAQWLGELCNYHIGAILQLCTRITLSPHLKVEDLLKLQVTGSHSSLRWRVLKAIISPSSHQYQARPDDRIFDLFGFWHQDAWAPLLPARILALLKAHEDEELDRRRHDRIPGFMPIRLLLRSLETHLGVPRKLARAALDTMRAMQLLETHDPDLHEALQVNPEDDVQVKITPCGRLHLNWSLKEPTYVRMMGEVHPLTDPDVCALLRSAHDRFLTSIRNNASDIQEAERAFIRHFIAHLLDAAARVSPAPTHDAMNALQVFEADLRAAWSSPA